MFAAQLELAPTVAAIALIIQFAISAALALYAVRKVPREYAAWTVVVAILALIYVGGYYSLAFTDIPVEVWSERFRYVSLLSIPMLWIVPLVLLVRQGKALKRALKGRIDDEQHQVEDR